MQRPGPSHHEVVDSQFGNNARIHQGDNTINLHIPHRPDRPAIHVIPYPRNEDLVHRPDLVDKLNKLLPHPSTISYSAALWGLGGSGKTQIALNYAYQRCANASCSVFWVHADSKATFSQDYKTIARKFGIDKNLEDEDLLVAVRDGIETLPNWVLILDNADDLRLFGVGLAAEQIKSLLQYIPQAPSGTVLWTTRDAQITGTLVGPGRAIEVARMRSDEAKLLLMVSRNEETSGDEAEIDTLVKELQWLPLAITQAGVYMRRTSTSVEGYLSLLAQSKKRWDTLKMDRFDRHRRPNVPNNVLETWAISIDRIREESEITYKILHVISYVSNENIPYAIIATTLKHIDNDLEEKPEELESEATKAIIRLKEFSFLGIRQMEDGNRNYEIHKLVQEAARYGLSVRKTNPISENYISQMESETQTGRHGSVRDLEFLIESKRSRIMGRDAGKDVESEGYFSSIALQVIDDLFPEPQQDTWTQCERYLAHAVQIGEWANLSDKQDETADLLQRVSAFLYDRGRWREQHLVDEKTLELHRKVLGDKHPQTICAIEYIASSYQRQGRYGEAEPLQAQVLDLRREILGDNHSDTILAMIYMAEIYRDQGRYSEAESLNLQVLNLRQEILGDKGPDSIDAMTDLAVTYRKQGRYTEAESLYLQALDLQREINGDKRQTIRAMGGLAATYHEQGQLIKAESLTVQVMDLEREVLGDKHHPDTAVFMGNLAGMYSEQGRHSEAEALGIQLLSLQQDVLGDKHPHTIKAMESLAATYGIQGRYNEAERLKVQVLCLRQEVLGDKHLDTITAMGSLAATYGIQGRHSEAEPLEVQVLSLRREVLGEKHLDSITAMGSLAATYGIQGRYNEAERLKVQVLSLRQEVLGDTHLDTIEAMDDLAHIWYILDRDQDAIALMQQCLQYRHSILGPEHPDTIESAEALEQWKS
ncbi:hypothetical protein ACHAQJ_003117 [Trichoderma viride]